MADASSTLALAALAVFTEYYVGQRRIAALRAELVRLNSWRDDAARREAAANGVDVTAIRAYVPGVVTVAPRPMPAPDTSGAPERVVFTTKELLSLPSARDVLDLCLELRAQIEQTLPECTEAQARAFDQEYIAYGAPCRAYVAGAVSTLWRGRGRDGFEDTARRHGVSVACVQPGDVPEWTTDRGRYAYTLDVALVIVLGPHRVCGGNVHVGPRLWAEAGWNHDKEGLDGLVLDGNGMGFSSIIDWQ